MGLLPGTCVAEEGRNQASLLLLGLLSHCGFCHDLPALSLLRSLLLFHITYSSSSSLCSIADTPSTKARSSTARVAQAHISRKRTCFIKQGDKRVAQIGIRTAWEHVYVCMQIQKPPLPFQQRYDSFHHCREGCDQVICIPALSALWVRNTDGYWGVLVSLLLVVLHELVLDLD